MDIQCAAVGLPGSGNSSFPSVGPAAKWALMRLALLFTILGLTACAPPVTRWGATQGPDSSLSLVVARGAHLADVGEPIGLIVREIDGEGCFTGCGNPFSRVSPGERKLLRGTLETAKAVTIGYGSVPGSASWRSAPFEATTKLLPGWAYMIEPLVVDQRLLVAIRPLCQSDDFDKTIQAFLRQQIFGPGRIPQDLSCS